MKKCITKTNEAGFSLIEGLIAVTIIGLLSALSTTNFLGQLCRTESSEAESTIGTIQAIIAAYIDETGAFPNNWNDLSSITAIMTNNGPASGNFSNAITLPSETYTLAINGPVDSQYEILAERTDACKKRNIKACFDLSTGASDLRKGDGNIDAQDPICS